MQPEIASTGSNIPSPPTSRFRTLDAPIAIDGRRLGCARTQKRKTPVLRIRKQIQTKGVIGPEGTKPGFPVPASMTRVTFVSIAHRDVETCECRAVFFPKRGMNGRLYKDAKVERRLTRALNLKNSYDILNGVAVVSE